MVKQRQWKARRAVVPHSGLIAWYHLFDYLNIIIIINIRRDVYQRNKLFE